LRARSCASTLAADVTWMTAALIVAPSMIK
jgi:hypothetical protein